MSGSYQRLSLLLIFVLALMFIESAMFGCVRCDDWPSSIQAASDEGGWRSEIYNFLNYDSCDNINSVCGASHSTSSPLTSGRPVRHQYLAGDIIVLVKVYHGANGDNMSMHRYQLQNW